FEGSDIAGIGREGLLESLPLRAVVASLGSEPGPKLVDPRRREVLGSQMVERLAGFGEALGGHGPLEPAAPGRRSIGPPTPAGAERGLGLREPAVAQGQVAAAEPDPVVLRGLLDRTVERRPYAVDRQRIEVEGQVKPEDILGITTRTATVGLAPD